MALLGERARALPVEVQRSPSRRRAGLATTGAVLLALTPAALAAGCSTSNSTYDGGPRITTSASATGPHTGGSVRPTETQSSKLTPTETPTTKPDVGTTSTIEVDGKEVEFTLLTPKQLKEHWEDFVGKNISLVIHPHSWPKKSDVLEINTQGKLYTGTKEKPTHQFVIGEVTFSDDNRFPIYYQYLTAAQTTDVTNAISDTISPTGDPFPFIATVISMPPGLLYSHLKEYNQPTKGINPDFALIELKTFPNTNGIRHAATTP